LYYHQSNGELFFASEVKAILLGSQARFAVNPDAAVPYLTRGLLNVGTDTFFRDIHQFPAASYQVLRLGDGAAQRIAPERFWWHPFEAGERPGSATVTRDEIRAT